MNLNQFAAAWAVLLLAGPNVSAGARDLPLVEAVKRGDTAAVRALLRQHPDVNAAGADGTTALYMAAERDNVDAVDLLVRAGADVRVANRYGVTPLLAACTNGNAAIIEKLLQAGADPNTMSPEGETALMTAARTGKAEPVKLLVAHGAKVDAREQLRGQTAIMWAAAENHADVVKTLIETGADVNAREQGWTALHQLAWTRRPPIQHGLPPAVPTGNMSSLALAEKLLQYGADPNARMTREPADGARNVLNRIGSTPFLQAAKLADLPYMRLLIDYGALPSITTAEGATALMSAAGVGIWQVGESAGANEEAFEAVKLCYELGNDVNAVDANGDTALHGAAHRGSNEIVKFLVEKGARLDAVNVLGWTPWIVADGVLYPNTYNRRLETAQLLIKLGAATKAGKRRAVDLPPSESQLNAPAVLRRQ